MTDVLRSMPSAERAALRTFLQEKKHDWLDKPAPEELTLAVMSVLAELAPKGPRPVRHGADLEVNHWYRIVAISSDDEAPKNAVGDVLQAKDTGTADGVDGELGHECYGSYWLVYACTMISEIEEVDPP